MNLQNILPPAWVPTIVQVTYLVAAVCFVLGLKGLSHPRTAVRGNILGSLGMLLAVVITLFDQNVLSLELIAVGVLIGGVVGSLFAVKIAMTAMPEMVALFNGTGGAASVLVATAALLDATQRSQELNAQLTTATVASSLIGSVTFMGSIIAVFKLRGIVVPSGAVTSPAFKILNALFAITGLALAMWFIVNPSQIEFYWTLVALGVLMGITLTVPIGGADMPVVIALLNSYSGLAACATGFVLNNSVLIISGSLVGASGIILTQIMCKAMNRSLANVLFGGLGAEASGPQASADEVYAGKVTSASADEAAMVFDDVRRVVIVPGYGMAVSQAQHAVREFSELLQEKGADVDFAIHPVAGRMPGHMNVLLAEADIPYEQLVEMDTINPSFPDTDVALVIGANDVVNPVAREDPQSPIAGMPILEVDRARTVIVVKRSLSPGFAGIPNPLFAADNTMMLFGDGKKAIVDLMAAIKEA